MSLDGISGHLPAGDGTGLFYQVWEALETKAWIAAFHGLAAHGGWYESLAGELLRLGIRTAPFDLRGHGLTKSRLADLPSPQVAAGDARGAIEAVRARAGRLPVFGMGTSLGGAVLLSAMAPGDTGLRGGILLSPAIKQIFISPGEMIRIGVGFVFGRRIGFPTPLGRGLTLTTDERRQADLLEDKLSLTELPSMAWLQSARIMADGKRAIGRVGEPLLVIQGRDDEVIDPRENARLFETRDGVTWVWWKGAHDVKLSPALDGVARVIDQWIDERIAGG